MFLTSSRLRPAEHYFTYRAAAIPEGVDFERVLEPEFWAHCTDLKARDVVRLDPEDGSYFAEVIVTAVGRGFAKVKLLRHVPLEDVAADTDDALAIAKWGGPHLKWTVIRQKDGQRLKDGLATREDAEREARGYEMAVA